jgi:hypothetical protein
MSNWAKILHIVISDKDILTQKHYESDLIRPEIENQSKWYPIDWVVRLEPQ